MTFFLSCALNSGNLVVLVTLVFSHETASKQNNKTKNMTTTPFDQRDGYIWMNGKMLPWKEAKTHILCHGLHYASSVFEGERIYSGNIFKLREHSERLVRSGKTLDIELPLSVEEIDDISREVTKANNIENGYLRPIAWRGSEQMAISAMETTIHMAFACWDWPKYFFPKGGEDKGIALLTSSWRRPHPDTAPVQSKASGIYMIGTIAKHEADRQGYDDVLMLDYAGRVAESSGSNIFFIKGDVISTPIPECFLNGITRQTVMKIAADMGYDVQERTIMPEELDSFEEVFVTGTAAEITPVGKIDRHEYEIGPITKKLLEAYQDMVHQKEKMAVSQ